MTDQSPRNRFLTVYGRMAVLEALRSPGVKVAKVFVSQRAQGGDSLAEILAEAAAARVPLERVKDEMVAAIARNGRHHQGVAADVAAPRLSSLADFIDRRGHGRAYRTAVVLLDGIHNPSNLGMIIRSATAAGLDGIVVPRRGTAELGPLTVKASAGVAFDAPIVRCEEAAEAAAALGGARFELVGVDATAAGAEPLFQAALPERVAFVVGNEREGVSAAVRDLIDRWVTIPMGGGVESLNVACAATLVAFEVARRRGAGGP